MPEFMSSQDIAATSVFLPSAANVRHTFEAVLSSVLQAYPGVKSGSTKIEPWPDANAFLGWFNLKRSANLRGSRFTLLVGICFGGIYALLDETSSVLPRHEPFFLSYITDDNSKVPVTDILATIPDGWALTNEEWSAVALRTLGSFPADPNLRTEVLIAWSIAEIGRLLAQINTYQRGPAEENDVVEED